MTNIFKYSIIRVEPDLRRGERVNVGIVIFKKDSVDVRILDSRKATMLASTGWDTHIRDFTSHLETFQNILPSPEDIAKAVSGLDPQINLTSIGWFKANSEVGYEAEITRLGKALVKRPPQFRSKRDSSVATEITSKFKSALIMAGRNDDIGSGLVIKNYLVDADTELTADFALKNGRLHLTSTLDLTSSAPQFNTAAKKAITLDMAKRRDANVKAYGVYAIAPGREQEVKEHIAILGDYSDEIFNWHDPSQREKYQRRYFDAYNSNHPITSLHS